jgi:hypothetical protein
MELEMLLPSSQQTDIGPYPRPDESSTHLTYCFNVNFNIIFPSTLWSSKWTFRFSLSRQHFACSFRFSYAHHCPASITLFDSIILYDEAYKLLTSQLSHY